MLCIGCADSAAGVASDTGKAPDGPGPADAPVDVPIDMPIDLPAEVVTDSTAEAQADLALESPVDAPADVPIDSLPDVGPADACPWFPDGISCADALPIPWCNGVVLSGDTCGAADDFSLEAGCGLPGTPDRVYIIDQNLLACGCPGCPTYGFTATSGFIYEIRFYNEFYGGCSTQVGDCGSGFGLSGGCGYTHLLIVEKADGGCGPYTITVDFFC